MALTKIGNNAVPSSAVTQHVTDTDLQPVKSDISALALREATNESSAAFNLPNQFIDTFTDDTNLGTQTTIDRIDGYIASVYSTVAAHTDDSDTVFLLHMDDNTDSSGTGQTISLGGNAAFSTAQKKFGTKSLYIDGQNNSYAWIANSNNFNVGTGAFTVECYVYGLSGGGGAYQGVVGRWWSDGNIWDLRYASGDISGNWGVHDDTNIRDGAVNLSDNTWYHLAWTRDGSGDNNLWLDGVNKANWTNSNDQSLGTKDLIFGATNSGTGYIYNGYIDEVRLSSTERYTSAFTPHTQTSNNATGTLIQSANTVGSAKTKVGGTMLYKDNAGTATLGTDLKIYFTCNGGTNWTEASSYSAITPVYSSGIKQVRLGETTCTSGTDVRYKAVWANQASGSKVTQLHGIGVNY